MTFFGDSPLFVPTLIVLSGVVIALVYLLYRIRQRQAAALRAPESGQSEAERAYNQIRFVRAGCDRMGRDGYDVGRIRMELEYAETAERRGDPTAVLRHTDTARQGLFALRAASVPGADRAVGSPAAPEPTASAAAPADPEPEVPSEEQAGTEPSRPKLTPYQVEARFAINRLAEDLSAVAVPPGDGGPPAAREQWETARAAYAREEYAEAWKLALKGRRTLGGHVEGIPLAGAAALRSRAGAGPPPSPSDDPDRARPISGAAGGPCARCGRPTPASDAFCRSCGAPTVAPRCPRCRAPLDPSDQFCGGCGTPRDM